MSAPLEERVPTRKEISQWLHEINKEATVTPTDPSKPQRPVTPEILENSIPEQAAEIALFQRARVKDMLKEKFSELPEDAHEKILSDISSYPEVPTVVRTMRQF